MLEARGVFFPGTESEVKIVLPILLRVGGLRSCCRGNFFFSGQGCNKVRLPSLASIIRECLFEMVRIRGNVGPDNSNQDGFAIERLLGVKLTAPIFEFTDGGLAQSAVITFRKIHAPLTNLGIV